MQDKTLHATLGLAILLALIASAIAPYDRATWLDRQVAGKAKPGTAG